ncbi:expressed unknown protein [Seminavis robusta]|uniref:Uncharacterized protein n=1 Tax=Seminavis robusta TaxID=568900 RepID=A0A9N8E3Q1_9STRA|nr:expressed unknown protein [Seminavis robusta]|eukprot:Sro619_g176390.1 n/a (1069) ;mRNA; f:14572-17778
MDSAAYQPVLGSTNALVMEEDQDMGEQFHDEPSNTHNRVEPLELGEIDDTTTIIRTTTSMDDAMVWPHISLAVTIWFVVPVLAAGMVLAFSISGRIWTCVLFSLHMTLSLFKARWHNHELIQLDKLNYNSNDNNNKKQDDQFTNYQDDDAHEYGEDANGYNSQQQQGRHYHHPPSKGLVYFWMTSLPSLMDIVLFGLVYPAIAVGFRPFFVESDGTVVIEWTHHWRTLTVATTIGWIIFTCRVLVGARMLLHSIPASTYYLTTTYYTCTSIPLLGTCVRCGNLQIWRRIKRCFRAPPRPRICWQIMTFVLTLSSTCFLGWTIFSLIVHFGPFEPAQPQDSTTHNTLCNPLDTTECSFPFPSMHHLKVDTTTETGYRVNLHPDTFPTLKGRIPLSPEFLNSLDGFSTAGPLLFYLEGMKESHEEYLQQVQQNELLKTQPKPGVTRLRGHEELDWSITPYSTTLLLDVDARELVPHSAEIDYLDPQRPLVMVYPAAPLKHKTHYALAVINATDANGQRLPPTPGMMDLFQQQQGDGNKQLDRIKHKVLPALEGATHSTVSANDHKHDWGGPFGSYLRSRDPGSLQLLFDFVTASKTTQIGPVRAVRDATLQYIDKEWDQPWKLDNHVRAIRIVEGTCRDSTYPLARTIHGELDVPWFMTGFGPGQRDATLDAAAVQSGVPTTIGKAKFVVHIPCSLKESALSHTTTPANKINKNATAQPLRAVMEFGHGLFFNRQESGESFLIQMAHENGYIITAMDWRGMSQYDYPLVLRTMLAKPSLFESIRDNIIQGYANKFALQHFTRHGMLELPWFQFSHEHDDSEGVATHVIPQSFDPLEDPNLPKGEGTTDGFIPSVFYGISQGGILGAGYLSLSGPTGLIARGALGVPGTPFSLILSRSLQFVGYDLALLLNFYNNRHVRIFLSLAQMCWDSVEASGVLGLPLDEPVPPAILQAGLGDPIVPSLAAERLARAMDAKILPHNPRGPLYGIPQAQAADANQPGPRTALTEMLYQKDYEALPVDDELKSKGGRVHLCVRLEPVLQHQLNVFFQSGRTIDPCATNKTACVREKAIC